VGTITNNGFLEQFEAYLSDAALAPATIVNYMADLRAFLRWSEKTNRAAGSPFDLATDDIQAYCSYLQHTKDHAPATINRKLQTLRKFYDLGVEQGWTDTNPAQDVPLLGEVLSDRSRLLTPDDVSVLLEGIQNSRSRWARRDWAIIQVLGANPPCLDVCVNSGGTRRSIPLEADVCAALRSYLAARQAANGIDHLFVNRDGNPLSTRSVQRLLHRYARAAGLDTLTTQALRYIYARKVYEQSQDLEAVAELLGHRHLATTARYLRPHSDE
jgi:integrase/recombinase XerC